MMKQTTATGIAGHRGFKTTVLPNSFPVNSAKIPRLQFQRVDVQVRLAFFAGLCKK